MFSFFFFFSCFSKLPTQPPTASPLPPFATSPVQGQNQVKQRQKAEIIYINVILPMTYTHIRTHTHSAEPPSPQVPTLSFWPQVSHHGQKSFQCMLLEAGLPALCPACILLLLSFCFFSPINLPSISRCEGVRRLLA